MGQLNRLSVAYHRFQSGQGLTISLTIIFGMVFIFSLWAVSQGWNHPLMDFHSFRQTQTAISTAYLIQGGNWLSSETPVLGAPWSIPFEFPVYRWMVARVHL